MTTPIFDMTEWAAAQASPWVGHNAALRLMEALIRGSVSDRGLSAPPGACADGAAYLIAASPTGAWAGHAGEFAVAVGVNAASGWLFADVETEGALLYVDDEDTLIQFDGATWNTFTAGGGSSYAAVVTESGAAADLDPADAGKYQRWTNAAAKSLTVRDEADVPLPADAEWHIRNVGAANLTLVEDTAVTINPPAGGTLVIEQGGTVTLKRVTADEFDLFGATVAV